MTQKETEAVEQLAVLAEVDLESRLAKKDLKERRGLAKLTLYDGSKKLKHTMPKGKKF